MLRNILSSSANVISSLNLSYFSAVKAREAAKIGNEMMQEIAPELKLATFNPIIAQAEEYSDIPESDDSKQLSHSQDPVVQQMVSLLQRKEFSTLIKVAFQALNDGSLGSGDAYLQRLDKMEDIVTKAQESLFFADLRLDYLHGQIIRQKTALHEGSIQIARAYCVK